MLVPPPAVAGLQRKGGEFGPPDPWGCMTSPDPEPTEMDYAAWLLVAEVLNAGSVLSGLWHSMRTDLSPDLLDGEDPEAVLLEMMVGSALPALRKAGAEECRRATELVGSIHRRVMDDVRLASEIAERRGGPESVPEPGRSGRPLSGG